ncbi:FtsK/SpoIIIE domain-containing protein [Streptomyces sp. H27-D2]|uniref:FtsK/SpoIIIE domain-containing protein n=1 Tax=Streptomyces sp. H27-D2 TaxID=3046304 RepID=UPI002DC02B5D|nr:FtsK/SpoIIIE domain-containing protein [Streptomyces sp. H27-D2]MEC4018865.1 FtsK/SpoIIIE domain-containing protein [Streptomyces sp. H27-D2]
MTDAFVPATDPPPRTPEGGIRWLKAVPDTPPEAAPAPTTTPAPVPVPVWTRTGRAVRVAVTHERTRSGGRLVARHGMYVVGGTRIVTRRAWDGRSAARYERMIRTAEAAGQPDVAAEWEERGRAFRAARHQRRMDLLTAPGRIAKGAAIGAGLTGGTLLSLGIAMAVASGDVADVGVPVMGFIGLVNWAIVVATLVWGPLVTVGPWLALLALWGVGRQRQAAPQWALPAAQRATDGAPITPSIVVTAMRDLGIAALRTAIRDMGDAGASMLGPIRIAGCGVEADVTLPSGVSTEEIQGRRRKLAENLNRHEHEVFIAIPPSPRTVRLWIADSGALDEPIGPSPLVTDPDVSADLYHGRAPWGQDLRGDAALISLKQRMMLITGLSNQGKTASLRALALWLAFDATVEFRMADLKGVGDWRMFDGIATTLIQGPTDEHVMNATQMLEGGVEEMARRIELVEQSGSNEGVTRDMARTDRRFRPIVFIVDEAQVAYGSSAVGKDKRPYGGSKATSRYFQAVKKIHDQGRAVNVTLWEGTQDPTNENLPKRSREGNHIRASLVLGTESQAYMALGEQAVNGGAAPHKLRQGLDKGTLVVAGDGLQLAPGQASVTVRTHFIDGKEAAQIADRAKAQRARVTTAGTAAGDDGERLDPLADIAAVLADESRMRTQEVLQLLAERNPGEYRSWKFGDLATVLDGAGAGAHKSGGVMVVGRDRVLAALAARPAEDAGQADGA